MVHLDSYYIAAEGPFGIDVSTLAWHVDSLVIVATWSICGSSTFAIHPLLCLSVWIAGITLEKKVQYANMIFKGRKKVRIYRGDRNGCYLLIHGRNKNINFWCACCRFFSPLGMVPVVALVGLGLFERGFPVVKALVDVLLLCINNSIHIDSFSFHTQECCLGQSYFFSFHC